MLRETRARSSNLTRLSSYQAALARQGHGSIPVTPVLLGFPLQERGPDCSDRPGGSSTGAVSGSDSQAVEASRHPLGDLLAGVAEGDRAALAELYQEIGGRVFAITLRILGHRDLAEEVTQDTFLAIWQKADRYDPARSPPFTWIAAIARNRSIDRLRKSGERHQSIALDEGHAALAQRDDAPDAAVSAASDIDTCLKRLQKERREAILLAYYHGLSHEELAERMGAPLGTVKSWVRRGLGQLRDCLAE